MFEEEDDLMCLRLGVIGALEKQFTQESTARQSIKLVNV